MRPPREIKKPKRYRTDEDYSDPGPSKRKRKNMPVTTTAASNMPGPSTMPVEYALVDMPDPPEPDSMEILPNELPNPEILLDTNDENFEENYEFNFTDYADIEEEFVREPENEG